MTKFITTVRFIAILLSVLGIAGIAWISTEKSEPMILFFALPLVLNAITLDASRKEGKVRAFFSALFLLVSLVAIGFIIVDEGGYIFETLVVSAPVLINIVALLGSKSMGRLRQFLKRGLSSAERYEQYVFRICIIIILAIIAVNIAGIKSELSSIENRLRYR